MRTASTLLDVESPLSAISLIASRYSGEGRNITGPSANAHFWLAVARRDHPAIRLRLAPLSSRVSVGSRAFGCQANRDNANNSTPTAMYSQPLAVLDSCVVAPVCLGSASAIRPAPIVRIAAPAK
jgi:hypothetical protein